METKKVVVIGGGTGTSTVVSGLKHKPVDITALISVADSGGSTGRLRDEFGFQPVGDLRQTLAALAKENGQQWIRKLLLYRFSKGEGLKGHNLGNLILTALQDMAGSTENALEIAEKIFRLRGKILPITKENVQLEIHFDDGSTLVGEHWLNKHSLGERKITHIRLTPQAKIFGKSAEAIQEAHLIVIGPGDYYASLMAALVVDGIKSAMRKSKAKVVYIANLMSRYNQTHGMTVSENVKGIEQVIGRACDCVVVNSKTFPKRVLEYYEKEQEYPVENDMKDGRCIQENLLAKQVAVSVNGDELDRSYIRHDSQKIAEVLWKLL